MYLRLLRLEAASRDGDAHARDQWTRSAVARGTLCSNTGASYQTSAGAGSGLALRAAHDAPPGTRVMLTASAAETAAGRSGGGNGGKAPTSHHDTQSLPPNVIATVETPAAAAAANSAGGGGSSASAAGPSAYGHSAADYLHVVAPDGLRYVCHASSLEVAPPLGYSTVGVSAELAQLGTMGAWFRRHMQLHGIDARTLQVCENTNGMFI